MTSFCQPKALNCAGFRNITERESPRVVVVKKLPAGDEWLYEVRWDGYRASLIRLS